MHQLRSIPPRQGLYDPAHEHDACGVGFVVNIKGVRSHDILQKGLQVLDNLTHRGACGCDPRTGDGAGVLMQIPHEFFVREADQLGFTLPAPGEYGVGQVFLPLDPERRKAAEAIVERVVREAGQRLLGWRTVPIIESACGDIARRGLPAVRQSVYRTRRWNHGCRGAGAQALRDSQNHHSCGRLARARRRRALLLLQSLGRDDRVQGPAHLEPDSAVLSRPQRPGDQDRACDGASAVFDQHLPELGPRASVPLSLPQRRDQHAAREYQLDGRAAGTVRLAAIRRRHAKAAADHRADRQRLLHVRQLPGAAGAYRALAAARGDDDDPGGVAERRDDERGQARVLRIPLQPDGAVGRAGLDRVHRRPAYRRRARSQRTAPLALPGDQGRDGRDGFRSRCARYSARAGRAQGPPAAGPHVLYRHGRGPHRRGRGNQGLDGRAQTVPAVARREPGRSRPVPRAAQRAADLLLRGRRPTQATAGLRLYDRRAEDDPGADGGQRTGAGGLDGHRHAAGGAVGQIAAAVQLLQTALRPGDQSADRSDPRRDGHLRDHHDRLRAEPVRGNARALPPAQTLAPGADQRGAGKNQAAERAGPAHGHALDVVSGRRGRGRIARRAGAPVPQRLRGNRGRLDDNRAFRSRRGPRARADPEPARNRRRASSSDPRGHAHARRAGGRIGRAARGTALLPAGRLWRGRGQSVSRVRDDGRNDRRGHLKGRRRGERGRALQQVGGEEPHQDRLQDGHLDRAELSRGADFRGYRA